MHSTPTDTHCGSHAPPGTGPDGSALRRILLVDDDRQVRSMLERLLRNKFDVSLADCGEQALCLAEERGPYAVIVSDYDMPDLSGAELLQRFRDCWPETTRVLMTGCLDVDVAIEGLHQGDIFRFIGKPFQSVDLVRTLEESVQRFNAMRAERHLLEQLNFARETLLSFTELLEERVEEQMQTIGRLHELAVRLNEAHSLEEIAQLSVSVASRVLSGRGVRLQLSDPNSLDCAFDVETGATLSEPLHVEPVTTPEGEIGFFEVNLIAPRGEKLSRTDRQVLASVASSTAIAAHNEIRRRERDHAQHATIFALARLAEHRDNETGKHLERVSAYCRLIALGLREDGFYRDEITDRFVEDLVRSAPLHDIGKVGVPDSILLKPGKLTVEEFEVMKEHSQIGADTMRAVVEQGDPRSSSFLQMGLDIAWCHHEKWNGGGYPRGLVGGDIPLSARILALADCYDALTSKRPYKEPWTHAEAVEHLLSRSDLDYDPAVVESFRRRVDRADRIRASMRDPGEQAAERTDAA